ncbi:hypothetical protein ACFY2K_13065 [Kitasatospora sp. NPDC001309]|uniref:hypothetical protein n=1 Tax=unclassified Kitasatospora TaxID=2633591 RepID=UPI0035D8A88F
MNRNTIRLGGVATLAAVALASGVTTAQAAPVRTPSPQLSVESVPPTWTIDRQAPAPAVPSAADAGAVTPPQGTTGKAEWDPYIQTRNVRKVQTDICGGNRLDAVSGNGPMTLTLSQSRAIASQWSATGGISAGAVSVGVGFSVTDTATYTETGSFAVPAGQYGHLEAYPMFDRFTYDVVDTRIGGGATVGTGEALHGSGYCYKSWTN